MSDTTQNKDLVLFSPQIEIFTPFAGYIDASRLNMASKQQLQAVISPNTETPIVIDKHYQKITTTNSPFAEFADEDGHVLLSDHETLIVYYPGMKKLLTKSTPPIKKLINNALSLKYRAGVGPIKAGELLYDYTNMDIETLMPKIGYRAKILFSSFYGYTADDAMVVSEGFAKRTEIEYTQKVFIPITKSWKYLRNHIDEYFYKKGQYQNEEAYVKYFPIDVGEHFMAEVHNISEQPSMFFTKNLPGILGGEIVSTKVHRNTEKTFNELKEEYMYTPGLINEIEEIYNDTYKIRLAAKQVFSQLSLNEEESTRYADELFETHYSVAKFPKSFETKIKDEFNLDPESVDFMLEVTVRFKAPTTRGDKFTNIFAGKGTVSMIIPDDLMPKDPETGLPCDIIFNPLGIFGRNNWGTIFELALSKIAEDIQRLAPLVLEEDPTKANVGKGGELLQRLDFIEEHFIRKYDEEYAKQLREYMIPATRSAMVHENFEPILSLAKDIISKGFYIFVPNFPQVPYTKFYGEFIKPYGEKFGVNFGKSKVEFDEDLIRWLRENWHYHNDVLGEDSYAVTLDAFIGTNYMLKLYHTAHSKFTAVSLANSYSKITGQPARGRKRSGGQHVSWQTFAALLGHKENSAILKELYTIKSDAPLKDKERFLMQYIVHGEYRLKPKYVSLTKKAISSALGMLGMQMENSDE